MQFSDDAAREMVEEFILGNGASASADWSNFFDNEASEGARRRSTPRPDPARNDIARSDEGREPSDGLPPFAFAHVPVGRGPVRRMQLMPKAPIANGLVARAGPR